MTNLELQDQQLRDEADALLSRHGVLDILRQFGTPHLSGSYNLQLMTWRDLDIYLEMQPLNTERFMDLGRQLGRALRPRRLSFTDHFNFPTTEALTGLYWGIRTDELSRGGWKIDVWGVTPSVCAERLAYSESLRRDLSASTRLSILKIKNEICRLPSYRKTITSKQVYDAVLSGSATSIEEFWSYLRTREETI